MKNRLESPTDGDAVQEFGVRSRKAVTSLEPYRRSNGVAAGMTYGARRLPAGRVTVVVGDAHPIALAGIEAVLAGEPDVRVLAGHTDGSAVWRAVQAHVPDVLVVDEYLPKMDGLAIARQLRSGGYRTRVVLLVTSAALPIRDPVELGLAGVLLKTADPPSLIDCVRRVHAGHTWLDRQLLKANGAPPPADRSQLEPLTRRQIEVARAAVSSLSNKELAQQLGLSEGTVKNHLHAIYDRLQVDGRMALLLYLKERKLA